ncbi:MAG: hypothetical protein IT345_15225 [Trueperaceae bacterium]|nr:hypothetical protein [Trueperaceae bacterium]
MRVLHRNRFRRPAFVLVCATALGLAAGCVHGRWELVEVDPDAARGDVEFQTITLQDDGSYFAQTNDDGVQPASGTYTYSDGVLDLQEKDGDRHSYEAAVVGEQLHLKRLWEGQKLKMIYERRSH